MNPKGFLYLSKCGAGLLAGCSVGFPARARTPHGTISSGQRPIRWFDLFKSLSTQYGMEQKAVRTSIDLPRDLHRRLHEAAARKGCSARKLMLAGIEQAIGEPALSRPARRLSLDESLVPPAGRRIDFTNEELYDLIEFP